MKFLKDPINVFLFVIISAIICVFIMIAIDNVCLSNAIDENTGKCYKLNNCEICVGDKICWKNDNPFNTDDPLCRIIIDINNEYYQYVYDDMPFANKSESLFSEIDCENIIKRKY